MNVLKFFQGFLKSEEKGIGKKSVLFKNVFFIIFFAWQSDLFRKSRGPGKC